MPFTRANIKEAKKVIITKSMTMIIIIVINGYDNCHEKHDWDLFRI